jgi:hypothetical protein
VTVSVAVVCEAPADRITITTLAERVIREAAPWIEPEAMGDYVEWRGFRRTDSHLEWTDVAKHVKELGLVVRFRHIEGSLQPYSQAALRAIRVLAKASESERIDAIILVPDSDGDEGRMRGLEQARDYSRGALPIIVGMAYTKRECWHICGFEPENEKEEDLLEELGSELGGGWLSRTKELTAKHDSDTRSAKRVLSKLCRDDLDRELRCLVGVPITKLKERGANNGLTHFLEQLEAHLVPLFAPPNPPTGV